MEIVFFYKRDGFPMHDVIIDDTQSSFMVTTQMEQHKEKLQKEKKTSKNEKFSSYLIDWLIKALIVASLISLNFLAFVGAGSYNMFSGLSFFTAEVWYILGGIIIFSMIVMYFLSFFKFLQNIVAAIVVFYFIIAMLNQFAAFDKNTMLASLAATYISQDLGILLTYVSHIVTALIIAVIAFLYFTFASKLNTFIFLIFLIMCNFLTAITQFKDSNEHQKFNIIKEDIINIKASKGKKFIFIGLQGLGSYSNLKQISQSLSEKAPEYADINKTLDTILGFYAHNGFIFYPQSYVNYVSASRNYAQILNANSRQKEHEYTLKNIYPERFWNFNNLNIKDTYLKDSRIYDTFKKSKFNIHAYQSSGIELCKINNEMAVRRCIEQNGKPVDYAGIKASTIEKTVIILSQWIESTGLFDDYSFLYNLIRPFASTDSIPLVGISYDKLEIKNSSDMLDQVVKDIKKDKGNVAYFINYDLPNDLYIYDEFCQIKPIKNWTTKNNLLWVKSSNNNEKRKAYAQQVRCVYGKLQKFIDKINQSTQPQDVVIFIQSLNGLNGLEVPQANKTFIEEFMNKKMVDSAIKDPLKKDFKLETQSCLAGKILTQYLYRKNTCNELSELNIEPNLKEKMLNQLHNNIVSQEEIENAKKQYQTWYKTWQEKQPQTQAKNITKEKSVEVSKAPEISNPVQEGTENQTQSLATKMQQESQPQTPKEEKISDNGKTTE